MNRKEKNKIQFKHKGLFVKLYHISHKRNRESILKHGLLPKGGNDSGRNWNEMNYTPRICLTLYPNDLIVRDWVSHWDIDIWEVVVLKKNLKEDKKGNKFHFYITQSIPSTCLRLYKDIPPYKDRILTQLEQKKQLELFFT